MTKTKKWLIGLVALVGITGAALARDVYVQGHTRSDGTYVAPHYRSAPDNSYNNNWNTQGNTNPHTGERGTNRRTLDDKPPPRRRGW